MSRPDNHEIDLTRRVIEGTTWLVYGLVSSVSLGVGGKNLMEVVLGGYERDWVNDVGMPLILGVGMWVLAAPLMGVDDE